MHLKLDNFYRNLGASKEIREAITNQTAESELQAWNTVLPLVLKVMP